jgi:hypothetical protein
VLEQNVTNKVFIVDDDTGPLPNRMHEHFEKVCPELQPYAEKLKELLSEEEKKKIREKEERKRLKEERKRIREEEKKKEEERKEREAKEELERKEQKESDEDIASGGYPVSFEHPTIYDCLNLFARREQLTDENTWYCPECKV